MANKVDFSSKTQIEPWKGDLFESPDNIFGLKLMFVGLSAYWSHDSEVDAQHLIEDTKKFGVERRERNAFWTRIQQVGLGKPVEDTCDDERKQFWHSIALVNYVPAVVADAARKDPTSEELEWGWRCFKDTFETLRPDCVVGLGWLVHSEWKKRSKDYNIRQTNLIGKEGKGSHIRKLSTDDHSAQAVHIRHPSGGFSSDTWRIPVEALRLHTRAGERL
ncbi:hypothetical protein J2T60_001620 [Natronospira proteinivora]|uniref:Uracil DNA glycosylase superfamily protein n=1 Tax=Natronospira proteinivora TaxID=1807133 RepID=A0ABT1G8K1_9GAMM|nr:hypothetical protein [Natronospira proteinivora]